MNKREESSRSFNSPSPGALLRQHGAGRASSALGATREQAREETNNGPVEVGGNPFAPSPFVSALRERRVMLAPLLVQWNYKVRATLPFAKWLKTKEVLLSDARFMVNCDTVGIHYFGTYILQGASEAGGMRNRTGGLAPEGPTACQTLWGFSDEASMLHMFELCRGRIDRASIVETDLREFVGGLRGFVSETGTSGFSQSVLVAPAAL